MGRRRRRLERVVVGHYGNSAGKRIGLTALLAAVGILLRKHPRAALHMAAAGVAGAGRAGIHELKQLAPGHGEDERPRLDPPAESDSNGAGAGRLTWRERQALLRFLKRQARGG